MHTFVIRVYESRRETPDEAGRLRGVVEEISTGFHATFHETSELLSILDQRRKELSARLPETATDAARFISEGESQ